MLILRKQNAQARLEGRDQGWADTDYAVLDNKRVVGRIYYEVLIGEPKWRWFLNTSPYPAPLPHNGVENSLEEAKQAFKRRCEQVKDTHYRLR
jgi:hypothetical protein